MDTPEEPWASTRTPSSRPASQRSGRSARSSNTRSTSRSTEATPLLARPLESEDEGEADRTSQSSPLLRPSSASSGTKAKSSILKKRWPSIVALVILCVVAVTIMMGFLTTEGLEEYAMQAANFEPTRLSLDSMTESGVRVRVEGDFKMDASRVKKKSVRDLGRFGTWIAREVKSEPTEVHIYLPDYENLLMGTAKVPSIKVNVRNGHTTHVSFFSDLLPGPLDGIRNVANDWLDGRLGQIRVQGKAEISLQSGLARLRSKMIEHAIVLEGDTVPSFPAYNITKLNIREAKDGYKGMGADASLVVTNDYPVDLNIPRVAVDVLVDNCTPNDPYINIGTAESASVHMKAKSDLKVNVTARVEKLPDSFTQACPNSAKSPLDTFLGNYMHGEDGTVYIKCCNFPDPKTPDWARDLFQDITLPVPIAGRDFGNMVKNFSLADVHFHLPDLFADPDTPEAQPKVSATIKVEVGLPDEMNFPLDVDRIKADADVFYHKKKFGKLHLDKWQKANSTRIEPHDGVGPSLLVESSIKEAPLEITDDDLFSEVVQALIFGRDGVILTVKAAVSVGVVAPIGRFAVRDIPAEGVIPVKPIGKGDGGEGLESISPKVGNLTIVDTSATSITLSALVNFTNPTKYSATVPYFNINILVNGTTLGQAIAEDIVVIPGNNTVTVRAVYDPFTNGGKTGKEIGKQLISQYISGYNTSLTLQTHNKSVPAQPALGFILSRLPITLPTPRLHTPKSPDNGDGNDDDDPNEPNNNSTAPHFIRSATMHLLSSTAVFTLSSPFTTTTLYITYLNATSYYKTHQAGKILYELPFAVPPGLSDTPNLPVDWSLGSVGYDAIRKALGGTLKLSAFANVGIRIGEFQERIWYKGGSIGAHVKL